MNYRNILAPLVAVVFLFLGTLATQATSLAKASTLETVVKAQEPGSDWSVPVNLSRSGASTNPQMVLDSAGTFHILWEDEIDGFIYSSGGAGGWSNPQAVEFPFFTRRTFPELQEQSPTPRFSPYLVADQSGLIHAFWVDDRTDRNGILYHSSVTARSFGQYDAWSAPQTIDSGAIGPTAVADNSGLHLVYVRRLETADRQAGIYYQRLPANSQNWTNQRALYQSRYLRSLSPETSNISITALADGRLVAAWDDRGREMVFAAQSPDSGATWGAPFEIDRRASTDAIDAAGPGGVSVGSAGSQVILTWGAGHQPGWPCTQYYRTLPDASANWSLPQIVPGLNDCLSTARFINEDAALYLFGTIEQRGARPEDSTFTPYLLAWDGSRWSEPQLQANFTELRNPDTNQFIELSCLQVAGRLNQISLVGCDRGIGGDVWWSTRSLGDSAAWFPAPSVWQGPDTIANNQQAAGDVELVTDSSGPTHAFWIEPGRPEIFHSRWDGATWSSAAAVVRTGSEAITDLVAVGTDNRLFIVYQDGGALYFSRASSERPTEWSSPIQLPAGQSDVESPTLMVSGTGELLVTYSVSLNEPRGVYLMRSSDQGGFWTEPAQIFSGAAAGWPAVGASRMATTTDGRLHSLWLQISLPPESAPQEIAYSQSGDGGLTWSPLNPVITTPTLWATLLPYGDRTLHMLWGEPASERMIVWHSQSRDSGGSWSERVQVGSLDLADLPAASLDPTGQVHLLGMENGRLMSWVFDGASWRADESFLVNLIDGGVLANTVDVSGRLVAVYASILPDGAAGEGNPALLGMNRPLDLPVEALPTPPPPQPTATPEPTVAPTATPEPTPTVALPTAPDAGPLSSVPGATSRMGQLAIAAIPAGFVVMVVFILAFRAIRKRG